MKLEFLENGPILLEGGPFRVWVGEKEEVLEKPRVFLCRCGGSSRKPFCDGTHKAIGFQAPAGVLEVEGDLPAGQLPGRGVDCPSLGTMRYRKLGQWGLRVSEISLGAWVTFGDVVKDKETVREIVKVAYEGGVNFFDNADVYAKGLAEEIMGEILKEFPRHTLVLSTKAYWPMSEDPNDRGLSRKHLLESIAKSLKRLKTDYVDLFFAHRYDPEVPMEEIVYAMHTIVEKGYALYWGTSEWPAARIAEAVAFARENGLHPPVVEQPQYSMLYRERVEGEILPEAERFGMGLVVWSPLAMGMLTGRYDAGIPQESRFARYPQFAERFLTEENRKKVLKLKAVADELGLTRTQLALAWVLRLPGISSAITGATRPEQIKESLGAAGVDLPQEALERIEAILKGEA